jgi:hypothetical protein
MPRAAVFEEENSLPGAELHFAIDNRDRLARARKNHTNVRRHVVGAFLAVLEVIRRLRDEAVEKFFQIAPGGGRGIFHDDEAATGMLDEGGDGSAADTAFVDPGLHFIGNLVGALTVCANFQGIRKDAHKICGDETSTDMKISRSLIFGPSGTF